MDIGTFDLRGAVGIIKERVSMPDVIGRYHHHGAHRGRTSCPIHGGTHDNLGYDDRVFHCFVCGARGDVIAFVKAVNGCDFSSAVRILDADFGLELDSLSDAERRAAERRAAVRAAEESRVSALRRANGDGFRQFHAYLWELRSRSDAAVNPVVAIQLEWVSRQMDLIMEDKLFTYPYDGISNSILRAREACDAYRKE